MKKIGVLVSALLALALLLGGCGGDRTQSADVAETVQLGIIQIAEHPSLDVAREGFLEGLAEEGYIEGEKLVVDYKNAQGDMSALQNIARSLAEGNKDLILAIATDSAIAMANETAEIPILVTAVTDLVAAKLIESNAQPGTNVTGTSDINPVHEQLSLIKEIIPDVKTIGVLYNSSEINSQIQVDIAAETASELGLNLELGIATNTNEVMQAAQSLVGKVDAYYLPTDNTVISALASVIAVAEENMIPVFSGETDSVQNGALATIGINYHALGRITGLMAARILEGESPKEMAVQTLPGTDIVVNRAAAERMGVEIPAGVISKATSIVE